MPENITVTLKTEKPGGLWPFVRGTFAWIGFGVVVVMVASILDTPNPDLKPAQIIEALGAGWRAYETAHHAKTNPDEGVVHVLLLPRPTPEERVCNRYDDHYSPERCASVRDPARASGSSR
jgi:hypothetical protein